MYGPGLLCRNVDAVRTQAPLVHSITNFVVMNTTANALLAIGASPIMAHAPEELPELAAITSSLVLNIGTLTRPWIESMVLAGQAARARGIPVVLDPVGAGASSLRTDTALDIMKHVRPAVVRGNASELMALAGTTLGTRGVDSAHAVHAAVESARMLAKRHGCIAVISGPEDVVTDGESVWLVKGGCPLMPRVTGMGCTATALIGAYLAVAGNALEAAITGMAVMAAAGGLAGGRSQGPGSFQVAFLDALYLLDMAAMAGGVAVERA